MNLVKFLVSYQNIFPLFYLPVLCSVAEKGFI